MTSVDVSSFTKYASTLRNYAPRLSAGVGGAMRTTAAAVAADIKERTAYSSRIPGSVVVAPVPGGATITVGGASAPDASPIENKGKGFVRHPTFVARADLPGPPGSWTAKNSHPAYFHPAMEAAEATAESQLTTSVDATFAAIAAEAGS